MSPAVAADRAASAQAPGGSEASDAVEDSVEAVAALHQDHYRRAPALQRLIDTMTDRLGRPWAVVLLAVALGAWSGLAVLRGARLEGPTFMALELVATVAALFLSVLILVTQRRANQLADRRAQLTLDLAILADRRSAKIVALLEELRKDHPDLADRIDAESADMAKPAEPEVVLASIEARSKPD